MPSPATRRRLGWGVALLLWGLTLSLLLTYSSVRLQDPLEQVRRFTRADEFDFLSWTLDAAAAKLSQGSLGSTDYLASVQGRALVLDYVEAIRRSEDLQARLAEIFADPSLPDPQAAGAAIAAEWESNRAELARLQPAAEAVLQEQVAVTLSEIGLGAGGEVFPPVSFRFSRLPDALIVSPRSVIRQDANVQLVPGLALVEHVSLEARVEGALDVSALVVPVGGIGTYPTMVQETTALDWVVETIVHEWVHNYLSLRPLGLNYETTPELRTMNETTASLLGTEIGQLVLRRYYPELARPPAAPQPPPAESAPAQPVQSPAFDFRAEMHTTRVQADALLAEGRIEEAEGYMEARRQIFFDQGYHWLRRLNQAYFAFYGAYADEPGGAAGEDPVGEAVRALRAASDSPLSFLLRMAWMDAYADLTRALDES
ncbi:MAG: hypothetical protein FJZ97_07215 [Chloroflexi bacterium]|nr:hypothetical protein [Chloroflexota bacterium]